MKTTIDNAGRVVIPEALRDGHLELAPAAVMTMAQSGRFFVAVAPPGTPPARPEAVDEFLRDLREGQIPTT